MIRWILVAAFALLGCPNGAAVCTHLETRCAEDVSQICDSRGRWETVADCGQVEGEFPFSCQEDDEGDHVCLPEGL